MATTSTLQTGLVRNISLPILNDDYTTKPANVHNVTYAVPRVSSFSTLSKPSTASTAHRPVTSTNIHNNTISPSSSISSLLSEDDIRVPQTEPGTPARRRRPRQCVTHVNSLPYLRSFSNDVGNYLACASVPDSFPPGIEQKEESEEQIQTHESDEYTDSEEEFVIESQSRLSLDKIEQFEHGFEETTRHAALLNDNVQEDYYIKLQHFKFQPVRVVSTVVLMCGLLLHFSSYESSRLLSSVLLILFTSITTGKSTRSTILVLSIGICTATILITRQLPMVTLMWAGFLPVFIGSMSEEKYVIVASIVEATVLIVGLGFKYVNVIDRLIVGVWVVFMGILTRTMQRR